MTPEYDVALVRTDEGWYNTTQAVCRAGAVARACERVLEDGGGRILDAFERLDALTVEARELDGVVSMWTFVDVKPARTSIRRARCSEADRSFDKG